MDGFLGFLILFLIYFLPTLVAAKKDHQPSVIVVNLFLGWTVIGWVVALAMAVHGERPKAVA